MVVRRGRRRWNRRFDEVPDSKLQPALGPADEDTTWHPSLRPRSLTGRTSDDRTLSFDHEASDTVVEAKGESLVEFSVRLLENSWCEIPSAMIATDKGTVVEAIETEAENRAGLDGTDSRNLTRRLLATTTSSDERWVATSGAWMAPSAAQKSMTCCRTSGEGSGQTISSV